MKKKLQGFLSHLRQADSMPLILQGRTSLSFLAGLGLTNLQLLQAGTLRARRIRRMNFLGSVDQAYNPLFRNDILQSLVLKWICEMNTPNLQSVDKIES